MPGIRLDRLQPLELDGLRDELMTPKAVERFRREFAARQAAEDRDRRSRDADLRKPLAPAQKAIEGCMRAIRDDHATPSVYAALKNAEEKKAMLEEEIANFSTAAPEIAPDTAALYRAQVEVKFLGLLGFADRINAAALSNAACSVKVVAGAGNRRILPALSAII